MHNDFEQSDYEGQTKDHVREGWGVLLRNDYLQEGQFKDNELNGFGLQIGEEGNYVGSFVNGLYEGKG